MASAISLDKRISLTIRQIITVRLALLILRTSFSLIIFPSSHPIGLYWCPVRCKALQPDDFFILVRLTRCSCSRIHYVATLDTKSHCFADGYLIWPSDLSQRYICANASGNDLFSIHFNGAW